MAQATTIKGGKVRVLLGDGGDPEVFTAPCGFTQRSLTFTKSLEDTQVPDCANPDAISWLGRDAIALSMSISGEGVMAKESLDTWLAAWESTDPVNSKIEIEYVGELHTWTGAVHVETFDVTAPNARRVTSTVSLQSDGKMTRVKT